MINISEYFIQAVKKWLVMDRKNIFKFFLCHSTPNIINHLTFETSGFLISLGMMHLGPVSPANPHLKENVENLII